MYNIYYHKKVFFCNREIVQGYIIILSLLTITLNRIIFQFVLQQHPLDITLFPLHKYPFIAHPEEDPFQCKLNSPKRRSLGDSDFIRPKSFDLQSLEECDLISDGTF